MLLKEARQDPDYRPGIAVDRKLALSCIRDTGVVIDEMEDLK